MKKKFSFILLLLSLGACTNNNTENSFSLDEVADSTTMDIPIKEYSNEEVQKVYGEIKFGISENEYNALINNNFQEIGGFEFEFTPRFNEHGGLYSLSIRGIEQQLEGNTKSKGYLIKLMEYRYGSAHSVWRTRVEIQIDENDEAKLKVFPQEIESYQWNIGDKRIVISSEPLENQDHFNIAMGNASFYIYPLMSITHIKMEEDFDKLEQEKKVLLLDRESDKF